MDSWHPVCAGPSVRAATVAHTVVGSPCLLQSIGTVQLASYAVYALL